MLAKENVLSLLEELSSKGYLDNFIYSEIQKDISFCIGDEKSSKNGLTEENRPHR